LWLTQPNRVEMKLIEELKRRNVFRVGAAYVLLGWLVIQITDTVSPALNLPDWTLSLVTWLGIIGLPFALFFAWAFELTPDGLRRESEAPDVGTDSAGTVQKLDIALIVLLLITIGFMAWNSVGENLDSAADDSPVAATSDGAATSDSMSIAVLPLINMSADSNNAYFAGGVHEEILTNLSRIDGLRVVSRTTALRYMESDLSLRDIGLDLGVRYIVEGSVRRVNDYVRITVQLIDAPSDAHLWASNYDRELVDVFAVQSEVAKAITNSLHLEIQPETIGTLDDMPTRSVKAYDLYTKAQSIVRSEPESEAALSRQRELLETAVATDPDFVEAWAALNEVLDHISRNILQNGWFGDSQDERDAYFEETQQGAHRALEKAVALDPNNVMSLLAQASDYVREQEGPEFQTQRKTYIDRALEIEPDNATAWLVLAWWYRISGELEKATPAFQTALELDPLNASIVGSSLVHFRSIGDQQTTTMLFDRLIQIAPEKAENESLGQINPIAKLENLVAMFGHNADESIIDAYAEELDRIKQGLEDDSLGSPIGEYRMLFNTSRLLQMQGDLGSLLARPPSAQPDVSDSEQIFFYLWTEADDVAVREVGGDDAKVVAAAERMLAAHRELSEVQGVYSELYYLPMSVAYAALGMEDEIKQSADKLANLGDDFLFSRMSGPFYAYSRLDIDTAVERLLQRKAEHPSWFGTDWIATLHVLNRHLLLHPRMQAFYVEEGKWIDYLAARVPEYANYAQ
jgi:TolB-like protein